MRTIIGTDDDYEFVTGICSEVCAKFKKILFNGKQHGMLTHYFAAPAAG